jgi:uncharacterized protein YdaU (DUF1376 family)
MAHEKSPAFQFYVDDWLSSSSVATMTNEQRGCYVMLLCYCWRDGAVPDDDDSLAALVRVPSKRWDVIKAGVLRAMTLTPTGWINTRLEDERAKRRAWLEKSSDAGKASSKTRRERFGSSNPRSNARTKREPSSNQPGTTRELTAEPIREPSAEPFVNSSFSSSVLTSKEVAADAAAPAPKRQRESSKATPRDPRIGPFIRWFAAESESITGVPYAVEWDRDSALIKALYRTYDDRTLRELAWSLLHTTDKWHDQVGRTIPTLRKQCNVLAERRTQTLRTWGQGNFTPQQLGLEPEPTAAPEAVAS